MLRHCYASCNINVVGQLLDADLLFHYLTIILGFNAISSTQKANYRRGVSLNFVRKYAAFCLDLPTENTNNKCNVNRE